MGSAAGSTFARIFFKQLNLTPPSSADYSRDDVKDPAQQKATRPPHLIARYLLDAYIQRIHLWWPFLSLPKLADAFRSLYRDPREMNSYDKFLTFTVMAIASLETYEEQDYRRMMDFNNPVDYFFCGLHFFESFREHRRDLQGLQAVLLLAIWMLHSNDRNYMNDLWQLIRYAMSIAIEKGLHRRNVTWGFGTEESEIRSRTWWCIYNLERFVAVNTGRVLSIRDHAIDAPKPCASSVDNHSRLETHTASTFQTFGIKLFSHMIQLRQLSGRILESIYIARGLDGASPLTTFSQICDEFEKLRKEMEEWKRGLDGLDIKGSRQYAEMKVEHGILVLLMYRPSPTFMVPSHEMNTVCSKTVSSVVRQWQKLKSQYRVPNICRTFSQLHAVLMVGFVGLSCDW